MQGNGGRGAEPPLKLIINSRNKKTKTRSFHPFSMLLKRRLPAHLMVNTKNITSFMAMKCRHRKLKEITPMTMEIKKTFKDASYITQKLFQIRKPYKT